MGVAAGSTYTGHSGRKAINPESAMAAPSRLGELAGMESPDFNAALLEAQSLRVECKALRAELQRHAAGHKPADHESS